VSGRRYLCLSCWRRLAEGEALYRPAAAERLAAAWMRAPEEAGLRPVSELAGRGLARLLADDEGPALAERLELYCPCGEPLTARSALGGGEELGVGFAGPRAAGKTLLTITAVAALDGARVGEETVSLFAVGDTPRRFRDLAAGFLDHQRQPAASSPEPPAEHLAAGAGAEANLCWELFAGSGRRRAGLLAVYDLAGETWRLPSHERRERFDRYLALVSSLVFLVDGAMVARDLGLDPRDAWDPEPVRGERGQDEEWLARVLDRLGEGSRRVDLALTVSKADLLWNDPRFAAQRPAEGAGEDGREGPGGEGVAAVLAASGRGGLLRAAEAHFRDVGRFAVSSLGFRPGPGDVGPDGRLLREPQPTGVTAPLLWLLGRRVRALRPGR
jgi:hypothetical protein